MSACSPFSPNFGHSLARVARQLGGLRPRSVFHPRSSNRTCRSPASGSPTGVTVRHTTRQVVAGVRGAAARVLHRQRHRRTVVRRALPPYAVWRGSRARDHRRIDQHHGMPTDMSRGRSSSTSRTVTCSACRALPATDRCLAGTSRLPTFVLTPSGRACAQIALAVRSVTVRSERVAKEVEGAPVGHLARFGPVEHQPQLRHHRLRVHASASAARPRLRMTKSSA